MSEKGGRCYDRTAQPSVAVAIGALVAAGVCFGRARQLSRRLSSPETSALGVFAA